MELRSVAYNPTQALGMSGMPGMAGAVPGMQGMPGAAVPGMQGVPGAVPGMQGVPGAVPGMAGAVPGMDEMSGMPGAAGTSPGMYNMGGMPGIHEHTMTSSYGMYHSTEFDPCCPMPYPPACEPLMKPHAAMTTTTAAHETYVVKKGDTIYKIAKRYGTTMQAIILGNNLRNPDLIYPGQILFIPGASSYEYYGG